MSKTLTAEEFLRSKMSQKKEGGAINIPELLIEFAAMHVEAALKSAAEQAKVTSDYIPSKDEVYNSIDKYSILNAYPKTNIK